MKCLTVGILKDFISKNNITDDMKIVLIENDAESAATYVQSGKNIMSKRCHDQPEGLRICNIGGTVFNEYENETAIILGFAYEHDFESIMDINPTVGCHIKTIINDMEDF